MPPPKGLLMSSSLSPSVALYGFAREAVTIIVEQARPLVWMMPMSAVEQVLPWPLETSLSNGFCSKFLVFVLLCRFAFVEFESAEEAKEAMDTLNGSEIEGRAIRLEYSQNSGGKQDGGRGGSGTGSLSFLWLLVHSK